MNPYQSPSTVSVEPPGFGDLPDAPAGKRFLNYLIDHITVGFGFVFAVAYLSSSAAEWMASLELVDFLVVMVLSVGYYIVLESMGGYTLGKLITGTKAISADGKPLSFWQVLGRSFARLIPFEPFSFLGSTKSGWHDTMPNTRVVDTRARPLAPRRPPPPPGTLPPQQPRSFGKP